MQVDHRPGSGNPGHRRRSRTTAAATRRGSGNSGSSRPAPGPCEAERHARHRDRRAPPAQRELCGRRQDDRGVRARHLERTRQAARGEAEDRLGRFRWPDPGRASRSFRRCLRVHVRLSGTRAAGEVRRLRLCSGHALHPCLEHSNHQRSREPVRPEGRRAGGNRLRDECRGSLRAVCRPEEAADRRHAVRVRCGDCHGAVFATRRLRAGRSAGCQEPHPVRTASAAARRFGSAEGHGRRAVVRHDDKALAAALLAAFKRMHADGSYDAIIAKWQVSSLALKQPGLDLATGGH